MLRQQVKNLYFSVNRWAALVNHLAKWLTYRRADCGSLYLHLGSGVDYRPGMVNIEGNILRRKDMWLDLRNGLPFPDGSAAFVYCCHTLEHFYPDQAIKLLAEIHRTLAEDGVARIAVPSFEHALEIAGGRATTRFPRPFDDNYSQAINYLFCDGQHKYAYSFATLEKFALAARFAYVHNYSAQRGVAPRRYGHLVVGGEPEGSLVIELRRTVPAARWPERCKGRVTSV